MYSVICDYRIYDSGSENISAFKPCLRGQRWLVQTEMEVFHACSNTHTNSKHTNKYNQ